MKPVELNDILQYSFLSNVQYAPGGKTFAFIVKKAKTDASGYDSDLWLYKDGHEEAMTSGHKVGTYFWEDSDHVLFTDVYDEEDQSMGEKGIAFTAFYRLDITNQTVKKAFTLPLKASSFERVDDSHMLIHGTVDALCPDAYKLSYPEREAMAAEKQEDSDYIVVDEVPFYENAVGYTNKLRQGLYFWDLEKQEIERITPALMNVYNTAMYQGKIAYTGFELTHTWDSWQNIYIYDPTEKKTDCIYDKKDHRLWALFTVGDKLIVQAAIKGHAQSYSCPGEFYEVDPVAHEFKPFSKVEIMLANMTTTDCRMGGGNISKNMADTYYYIGTVNTSAVINAFKAHGSHETVFEKEGAVDCFDMDPETGKVCAVCMFDNKLPEVYELDMGKNTCTQLTHINDKALEDRYVADYHPVTAVSDGVEVYGYVLLPEDFDENKKYPAILEIHGGPKGAYGQIFHHEMQMYAGAGYIVFFCNPTGSDGRGHEYAQIFNRLGDTDYKNLMDFTDAVIKAYPQIDTDRMGVTGGSYGGFMTNWIIGHTHRFKCAVSQRSISNWISFAGTSDIFYSATYQCGAKGKSLQEAVEQFWKTSPLKYADQVTTPTLFLHSDEDYRCPLEQGLQMYTALADQGVETRMCIFKGENHELSRSGKPCHRIRRLKEMKNWMDHHLNL